MADPAFPRAAAPADPGRAGTHVTLSLHRFGLRRLPWVLGQMGAARLPLGRLPGLTFAKLCGSGTGQGFTPRPNPCVWAILAAWTSAGAARDGLTRAPFSRWQARADEVATLHLAPLSSRGAWSGRAPFAPGPSPGGAPLAVLTRATVRPRGLRGFWRREPAVSAAIGADPDVALKIGIGEVPFLHQVTFSVWPDAAAMRRFARTGAHAGAIRAVRAGGWFAEELYAHFALTAAHGTWEGRDLARLARPPVPPGRPLPDPGPVPGRPDPAPGPGPFPEAAA
ncbi:MAG: spheroidene monooxygenase [Hasllibacter sp.]